jgi:two-component system OmpR family sensor kinase
MVELSVCDRGPGVPEDEREAVFQPFHRSGGAGEHAGTGLGLALVRQIARRHGGDARCLVRAPAGSCFVVTMEALRPSG